MARRFVKMYQKYGWINNVGSRSGLVMITVKRLPVKTALWKKWLWQEVDVWEWIPETQPIMDQTAVVGTVTNYNRVLEARAKPVCTYTSEDKCETVEWEDCMEKVSPNCIRSSFIVPYQEYDHWIRCSVVH